MQKILMYTYDIVLFTFFEAVNLEQTLTVQ